MGKRGELGVTQNGLGLTLLVGGRVAVPALRLDWRTVLGHSCISTFSGDTGNGPSDLTVGHWLFRIVRG